MRDQLQDLLRKHDCTSVEELDVLVQHLKEELEFSGPTLEESVKELEHDYKHNIFNRSDTVRGVSVTNARTLRVVLDYMKKRSA